MAFAAPLAGCGGSGGSGPNNNPGGGTVTETQRTAAIQATQEKCRELSGQNLSRDAFNDALATYLATRPEYEAAGVDTESQSVWGRFKDGRLHIIANNRDPLPNGGRASYNRLPAGRAATAYLPGSKQARLLHSFGANFDGQAPINDVGAWMQAKGYTLKTGIEGDARVATLRSISGDGFFYINTHGGRGRVHGENQDLDLFSIQSSTLVSEDLEKIPEYKDDLDNYRLTYMTALNGERILGGLVPDWDTRYAITANFVDKYWSFAPNSVVFINACYSGNTANAQAAGGFIFACHKKGAGVYLGWTNVVSSASAFDGFRYFADRLLGANEFQKEDPPQRAFDWQLVLEDMQKKGHATDPGSGAQLVAIPKPGGQSPHILTPSIERMLVDEFSAELILEGTFGTEQGKVTVQGTELTVKSWASDKIVCTLPVSGAGSSGDVQVTVQDHPSNKRQITEWDLTLRYKWLQPGMPALKVEGPVKLRFRADVGEYRTKPGETPQSVERAAIATGDSSTTQVASGSFAVADCTISWTGTTTFTPTGTGSDALLIGRLKIDPKAKTGALGLAYGAAAGELNFRMRSVCAGSAPVENTFAIAFGLMDGQSDFPDPMDRPEFPPIPLPSLNLTFGNDFTLAARSFDDPQGIMHLEWDATPPKSPPDPQAGRAARR
jgi:hypothetical protein